MSRSTKDILTWKIKNKNYYCIVCHGGYTVFRWDSISRLGVWEFGGLVFTTVQHTSIQVHSMDDAVALCKSQTLLYDAIVGFYQKLYELLLSS